MIEKAENALGPHMIVETFAVHLDRIAGSVVTVAMQHALRAMRDERFREKGNLSGAAEQKLGIVGDDAPNEAGVARIGQRRTAWIGF